MELRPILSAMLRNKTGPALVVLQIALTLAVVTNSVFIIVQRVEKMGRSPGFDSDNTFFVQSYGFGPMYDQRRTIELDLRAIRAMPGVINASPINGIPLSGGGSLTPVARRPGHQTIVPDENFYTVDESGIDALGVTLVAGRNFSQEEIQYSPDPAGSRFAPFVIVTKDLGQPLFGTESPLGKTIYDGSSNSAVVVGVIDNMLGAWVDWDKLTQVMLVPRIPAGPLARYVVRTEPGRRDALMAEVEEMLSRTNPNRAITYVRSHTEIKERSYRADSRMVGFLSVLMVLMIFVTSLGIVGLASFHVQVRRKEIGTRRAIGARRVDVIRYFMVENWLLTTAGILIGTPIAFAFGGWLSSAYSLPRLEPVYVVSGIVGLWVLGQVAALVPARRAATISPAIATRTV